MSDPTDLSNLRDIVVPTEVSFWPPAPGWWVVMAAAVLSLALLAAAAFARHRRNAYRREALRELDAADAPQVSEILKRAALAAWPREQVASLSGAGWLAFLDRTGRTDAFTRGSGRDLEALAYGGGGDRDAVLVAARRWLRDHRC